MARLLVWLSVLLSVLYSQGTGTCPVQCRCWKTTCNEALVYCYYRGLHGLPTNIPTDTCILNLGLNDLTLHYGIFDTLVNLRELYLENNELTWLPYGVFDALVNLQGLNLANNQITTLPNGIFDALPNLQRLKLDRNEIVTLPNGIFDALTNLQQLYLEYNQITTIQKATFGGLVNVTIAIEDNPLHCDCQLVALLRFAESRNIQLGHVFIPSCQSPSNLKGTLLKDGVFEDMDCDSDSTVRTDAGSTRIEIFTIAEDTHTTRPDIDTTSARPDSNTTGTRSVTEVTKK
ncbi:leucine-rich repeat-containing protein 15-like isoform X2 [Ostrea edulis]|uniref:leucine-rich repeat-containing protein 15-like isoform X2 n=1 Tax=Ostrea edulis TaxID=37623 RepID=UPI0024AF46DD|nr:leucine-rich repeat-containing protein 15-like isoform X2 [Ostrea edulis]